MIRYLTRGPNSSLCALVMAALAPQARTQDAAAQLRARFPADDLPRLLRSIESAEEYRAAVEPLRACAPRAHVFLVGILRNPPPGRYPTWLREAFGQPDASDAALVPALLAAQAQSLFARSIATDLLREIDAVAPVISPSHAVHRQLRVPREELRGLAEDGPIDLAWPVAQAAMASDVTAALEVLVALLERANAMQGNDPARAQVLDVSHAMRLEASARGLLSPDGWALLPPAQREVEWMLIARAGGLRARPAPELLRALRDDSTVVRGLAAIALVQHESGGDEAIAALEGCDVGTDTVARGRLDLARSILIRRRDEWRVTAVESCRGPLASGDEAKVLSALGTLSHVGPAALPLAPALFDIAARQSRPRDQLAIGVLANCGEGIFAPCAEAARSGGPVERLVAARVLGRLRPMPAAAVAVLLRLCADPDERVRTATLEAFGTAASAVVAEAVVDALRDPVACRAAAQIIERCSWYEPWRDRFAPHLETFAELVPDADDATRSVLFKVLRHDARAVPALGRLAGAADPKVRHDALGVLTSFGPKAAGVVDTVIAHVSDADVDVAVAAAHCLAALQCEAGRAVAVLDRRLRDDVPERLKTACVIALGAFGAAASGSTQLLERLLADAEPGLARTAAAALLRIVGPRAPAVELLRAELLAADMDVRVDALHALRVAKGSCAILLEPVVAQLVAGDAKVRAMAAAALRELGARAESALPALRAALGRGEATDYPIERAIEVIETAIRR